MTSNPIFRGVATALITPMTPDGVDYPALGRLIDWQIAEGVNALVIAGTTGEASTLSDEEHRELLRYSAQRVAGRIPVIAGTGSNDTAYAISLTKYACEVGCDAMLVVTPYYNKATQNGLVQMYTAIADASTKPIIVYNVPSRTGVNIQPATYQKLAQHPMIAGIKEANGDISSIVTTASLAGDSLSIYSGNDDQIVPILSMGGSGVISVLSNVLPRKTVEICTRFWSGDVSGSAARASAAHPRPVLRGQPHPGQGRDGRARLLRGLSAPAADDHGARAPGSPSVVHARAGTERIRRNARCRSLYTARPAAWAS